MLQPTVLFNMGLNIASLAFARPELVVICSYFVLSNLFKAHFCNKGVLITAFLLLLLSS